MLSEKFHLVKEGIGGLPILEKYMGQISTVRCDAIDIVVHFIEDICDDKVTLSPAVLYTKEGKHNSKSFQIPVKELFGENEEAKKEYSAFDAAKIVFEIEEKFYLISPLLLYSMSRMCNFPSIGISDSYEKAVYLQFLFEEVKSSDSYVFVFRKECGARKIVSAWARKADLPSFEEIIGAIDGFVPEKTELSQDCGILYSEFKDSDCDFNVPAGFVLGKEITISYTSHPRYKEMYTLRKCDQDPNSYFYVGEKYEDVESFRLLLNDPISKKAAGIYGAKYIEGQLIKDFLNSDSFCNVIEKLTSKKRTLELRSFLLKSA